MTSPQFDRNRGGVASTPAYNFAAGLNHFSTRMIPFMRTEWPGKLQM